jgi:hypothetical protein
MTAALLADNKRLRIALANTQIDLSAALHANASLLRRRAVDQHQLDAVEHQTWKRASDQINRTHRAIIKQAHGVLDELLTWLAARRSAPDATTIGMIEAQIALLRSRRLPKPTLKEIP